MKALYVDPSFDDEERRRNIYQGEILLYTPRFESLRVANHARAMLEGAFPDFDPRVAQHHMKVEAFAAIFAKLKPAYIHHPQSWGHIATLLIALGCDPDSTYLDVPRLRIATSDGYLTSGVAYAHHPHRDTWWSAPLQQINWWMPIYDFVSESAMAFHPRYWGRGVSNDSSLFNYYDWNTNQRRNASAHVKSDTRWQPHALEPLELQPELRIITKPGGFLAFSGAQMHSTVPNTSGQTRYSIDFRTIDLNDVKNGVAAPNVDSAPTGTSLRDFKRLSDGKRVPEAIAVLYDGTKQVDGERVFLPTS